MCAHFDVIFFPLRLYFSYSLENEGRIIPKASLSTPMRNTHSRSLPHTNILDHGDAVRGSKDGDRSVGLLLKFLSRRIRARRKTIHASSTSFNIFLIAWLFHKAGPFSRLAFIYLGVFYRRPKATRTPGFFWLPRAYSTCLFYYSHPL